MYEFTDAENTVIAKSSQNSMILGILLIVTGVARFCTLSWIIAAGDITMGILLLVAASSLKAVTTSQGQDVTHMMKAVGGMANMFIARTVVMAILVLWEVGIVILAMIGVIASL